MNPAPTPVRVSELRDLPGILPDIRNFLIDWRPAPAVLAPVAPGLAAGQFRRLRFPDLCLSWLIRDAVPAWVRAAGMTAQADRIDALPSPFHRPSQDVVIRQLVVIRRDAAKLTEERVGRSPMSADVFQRAVRGIHSTGENSAGRTIAWEIGDDSREARIAQISATLIGTVQALTAETCLRVALFERVDDPVSTALRSLEVLRAVRRDSAIRLVRRMIPDGAPATQH